MNQKSKKNTKRTLGHKSQKIDLNISKSSKIPHNVTSPEVKAEFDDFIKEDSGVDFIYKKNINPDNSDLSKDVNSQREKKRKHFRIKKYKLGLIVLLFLILIPIGFLLYKAYSNLAKTGINLNPTQLFQSEEEIVLDGEEAGRINVLLIGNGGEKHESGILTDTLMVASIDPIENRIAMLSIPRDLYVDIPGYGKAKINEAYEAGENLSPGSGETTLIGVVEKVTGLDINYSLIGSFEALVQAVDAVGGVTVNNPEAITDYNYPYNDPYPCTRNNLGTCTIQFPQGPIDLDGKTALIYARSRYSTSDYDRAYRQQLILSAILEKSLTSSNLINVNFISKILDIAGNNIKVDKKLSIKDLLHLYNLIKVVDKKQIYSFVLSDAPDNFLVQIPSDMFILGPKGGNYIAIQNFAKNIFSIMPIQSEQPNVLIENSTTTNGLAQDLANKLLDVGFNIYNYQQSEEEQNLVNNVIVDYSGGKMPNTISYLEKLLNTTAIIDTNVAGGDYDVKIILGSDYNMLGVTP